MAMLEASSLVKVHGAGRAARRVLDGVDLVVEPGEVVAILGRSGSGKSTLLHLLGALDRPDEGQIAIAGYRLETATERELVQVRRDLVGLVFQFFHLIPELTGEENVLLPARLPGRRDGAESRARTLIERLDLVDAASRRPHELSGGEQQRLAVARALVRDPAVILADEPTGNLDAASAAAVLGLLRHAAGEGRAVVIVTHEAAATDTADRILRLAEGRLEG